MLGNNFFLSTHLKKDPEIGQFGGKLNFKKNKRMQGIGLSFIIMFITVKLLTLKFNFSNIRDICDFVQFRCNNAQYFKFEMNVTLSWVLLNRH